MARPDNNCDAGISNSTRHIKPWAGILLVLFFAVLIAIPGLGEKELASGDETRVAGIAAEMFIEGDYVIPRLNGEPFLEYPPLYYWMIAGSYGIFGITDFAAKLPSAFAAILCGFITYLFARRMKYPVWGSIIAAVMLMTGVQFWGNSRKCMVDILLAASILLAVFSFYSLTVTQGRWKKLGFCALFATGVACGVYTKGLLGICIPGAIIGSWLVLNDIAAKKISISPYIHLLLGLTASMLIAGVWYWLVLQRGGVEMFNVAFIDNNIGRFTGGQGDHAAPFYYYLEKIPTLFFPWMLLMPFALYFSIKQLCGQYDERRALLLVFLFVPFVALSIASGKRIVYLLPFYAPCALICADFLISLPDNVKEKSGRLFRKARGPLILKIVLFAGFAALALLAFKVNVFYAACGVMMLGIFMFTRGEQVKLFSALGAVALFFVSIDVATAAHVNNNESLRSLFTRCAELEAQGRRIILIGDSERTEGAAFFYLHHALKVIPNASGNPPSGEYWVIRKRNIDGDVAYESYSDSHKLIGSE